MLEELDTAQRRLLAANAHHLNPVVIIGKGGLTEAVMGEINNALIKHELIKIKVAENDRTKRLVLLEQICQSLSCASITNIGKILVVYRRTPEVQNGSLPVAIKRKPVHRKKRIFAMQLPATSFHNHKRKNK